MMLRRFLLLCVLLLLPVSAWAFQGTANQITVQNGTFAFANNPIRVNEGGTGAATLMNHGVLIGQGTSAIVGVGGTGGTCTTGQVLTCNSSGTVDPSFQATPTGVNPVLGFGAGMDQTISITLFAAPGTGSDQTEAVVQQISPGATYKNLRCINSAIQGTGNNIVITGMVGACGSQSAGSLTCTITGTTGGNQFCADTTNNIAPSVNQCFDFRIVTPAALTANARVNCVVERTA